MAVVQFNPEDHKRLREFKIEPLEGTEVPIISSLAAHGRWLAVGTLKGKVAVFDTESGEQRMIFLAKP